MTVTRRTEEMADNLMQQLKNKADNFVDYSIALDESTDTVDSRTSSDCSKTTREALLSLIYQKINALVFILR